MDAGPVFVVLLLANLCWGLRWTEERRTKAGVTSVCSGQNLQLFWNFTLDPGERLKGVVWGCKPEGEEETVLATFADDHFVPMSAFSGRLAHLQDGGIEMSCATILESGNYSIAVSTEDNHNHVTVHHNSAIIQVVDPPKTQTGEILVTRKEEAVRDVTTGAWHVQLTCGNFSDRGHPPVDVIWTTPTGAELPSTSRTDGFFHLLLPNPPQEGSYSCSLVPTQAATRCLEADSPLLDDVSLELEETDSRFRLMEARHKELVDRMQADRDNLMKAVTLVDRRIQTLERWQDDVRQNSELVSFHAKMTRGTNVARGDVLKLTEVINNQGQGYNPDTGHFTAPVNGTYFFIGTAGSYTSAGSSSFNLRREPPNERARTHATMYASHDSVGSCQAVFSMTAGEKIWLESYANPSYVRGSGTTFSGFRLQ